MIQSRSLAPRATELLSIITDLRVEAGKTGAEASIGAGLSQNLASCWERQICSPQLNTFSAYLATLCSDVSPWGYEIEIVAREPPVGDKCPECGGDKFDECGIPCPLCGTEEELEKALSSDSDRSEGNE